MEEIRKKLYLCVKLQAIGLNLRIYSRFDDSVKIIVSSIREMITFLVVMIQYSNVISKSRPDRCQQADHIAYRWFNHDMAYRTNPSRQYISLALFFSMVNFMYIFSLDARAVYSVCHTTNCVRRGF